MPKTTVKKRLDGGITTANKTFDGTPKTAAFTNKTLDNSNLTIKDTE
jgi:hypothetical protein